ncbi:MAG: hypothetical protein RJA70_1344, partial [Pseudomonadota bacterium]
MSHTPDPLKLACATTVAVALLAWFMPGDLASTSVAFGFLAATYYGVLRRDAAVIRRYGVSLGGLLEPEALSPMRLIRSSAVATLTTGLLCLIVFPVYFLGYVWWFEPSAEFQFRPAAAPVAEVLGHWLAVGLPEEVFYRGYLQSAMDDRWPPKLKVLGAEVGYGLLVSSAIFALGHIATEPQWSRLA